MTFSDSLAVRTRDGFTLVELLAVIGIVGILAGLVLATVPRLRGKAEQASCASNLRQIHASTLLYAADHRGFLPNPEAKDQFPGTDAGANWWAEVQPYNEKVKFRCASHARNIRDAIDKDFSQNYGMNSALGYNTSPLNKVRYTLAALPNPSRTLMVTEGAYNQLTALASLRRGNIEVSATFAGKFIGGAHNGANNVLWCDGHVAPWTDVSVLADDVAGAGSKYWTPGIEAAN